MGKTVDIQTAVTLLENRILELRDICTTQQTLLVFMAYAIKQSEGIAYDTLVQHLQNAADQNDSPLFKQVLDAVTQGSQPPNPFPPAPDLRIVRDEHE